MIMYIILGLTVFLLIFLGYALLPLAWFVFIGLGTLIGIMGIFLVNSIFYPKIFPVRVRTYGDRYDAFAIDHDTRARLVKDKKGHEYLQTAGGKKFRMPDRKYLTKGKNAIYTDLYDNKNQQLPIIVDRSNMEDVRKMIIPEDQRVWFARTVIPEIKEITNPPKDRMHQIMVMGSIMGVIILLTITMLFYPTYVANMENIMKQKESKLAAEYEDLRAMYEKGVIDVNCNFGGSKPSEPVQAPPS